MTKQRKPFITEMQAEGTHAERRLERIDAERQARELVANLPSDSAARQMYVRNLVVRAMRKEIDPQTFEAFVSLTNIQDEVDAVLARARIIAERMRI